MEGYLTGTGGDKREAQIAVGKQTAVVIQYYAWKLSMSVYSSSFSKAALRASWAEAIVVELGS